MRPSILKDFSIEELQKLLEESGTQKKLAERLEVSPITVSRYLGKRRGKRESTGWVTKAEPMTTPISETAKVVQTPMIQPSVSFDQMEVNVKGKVFSYTVMRDHIEVWSGEDGVMLTYDEIPQFYLELSDALKVADKLHEALKPYNWSESNAGADES